MASDVDAVTKDAKKTVARSIRMPRELWEQADRIAESQGMNTPSWLRNLVVREGKKRT
jgi:predicted DNA-binding protein